MTKRKKKSRIIVAGIILIMLIPTTVYFTQSKTSVREILNWYPYSDPALYDAKATNETGYIRIQYTYEGGAPFKDLRILVSNPATNERFDLKTNENGEIWFLSQNATVIHTYHKRQGYYSEIVNYQTIKGRETTYNHTIRKYTGTRFYVKVISDVGDPIANATVYFNLLPPVLTNALGMCYYDMENPDRVVVFVVTSTEQYQTEYTISDYWYWDRLTVSVTP